MIIGFASKSRNQGGPGSFQNTFECYLKKIGWTVVYPENKIVPDIMLILGGTRKLLWLFKMKCKGTKIFFRLGGINWLYKYKQIYSTKRLFLNLKVLLTPLLQKYFAEGIIYQSMFSKECLIKLHQSAKIERNTIIYNGIDIDEFKPFREINDHGISLLCVEGNIDYSPYAIELLNQLQEKLIRNSDYKSLILYGNFENPENKKKLHPEIEYKGFVDRKKISRIYKNSVYLSLDVNPACPNTVIEALASGIPVIGFDTGALKELVPPEAGEIVPYGGDPWKLEPPNVHDLINAAEKVLMNWKYYSENARKIAEERYNIENTTQKYIDFFMNTCY